MNKKITVQQLLLLALLSFLLASCASKKTIHRTDNITDLSLKLKIEIKKNDKELPLYKEVASWLGVKYGYGKQSRTAVDCSGFTVLVYQAVYNKKLPRSSFDQSAFAKNLTKGSLRPGDLVFFATNSKNRKRINHVGIYLKDNKFIHASTSRGVIVSSLNEDYYTKAWQKGGRIKK